MRYMRIPSGAQILLGTVMARILLVRTEICESIRASAPKFDSVRNFNNLTGTVGAVSPAK